MQVRGYLQITYRHTAYTSVKGALIAVGFEEDEGEDDEQRPQQWEHHSGGHVEGNDRDFGSRNHDKNTIWYNYLTTNWLVKMHYCHCDTRTNTREEKRFSCVDFGGTWFLWVALRHIKQEIPKFTRKSCHRQSTKSTGLTCVRRVLSCRKRK